MQAIIWAAFTWAMRTVVVQFFIVATVFVSLTVLLPWFFDVVLCPIIGIESFSILLSWILTPNIMWFLNMMAFDIAFPLMACALVSRFVLRRIPFLN